MINAIPAADIAFIIKWLNASLLFLRMNYVKNVYTTILFENSTDFGINSNAYIMYMVHG